MPHVITDACTECKDMSCVEVCPANCIHPYPEENKEAFEATKQLYINPDSCIDCGMCIPVCPTEAIYPETELPDDKLKFIEINEKFFEDYEY
jgi:NAD-dependent dihydropyrimidine dehydrogenase PreA subunit